MRFFIALYDNSIPDTANVIFLSKNVRFASSRQYQHVLIDSQHKLDVYGYEGPHTFVYPGAKLKIGDNRLSFFTNFFILEQLTSKLAFFDDFVHFTKGHLLSLRSCDSYLYRTETIYQKLHENYIFGDGKKHRIAKHI